MVASESRCTPKIYINTIFCLTYIYVLQDNIVSPVKHLADDTSLFQTVYDTNASRNVLNNDLKKYQTGHT